MLRIWTNLLKATLGVPLAATACGSDNSPTADGIGAAGVIYGTGGAPPGGFGGATTGGSGGFGVAPTGGTAAGGAVVGGAGGGFPGGGTSAGGIPPAGAPAVSLSSSAPTLTEGQSVMFTALVNDPNGPQDIVGGTLTDATGTITYGPFVAASAGAFSITVDWTKMNQVQPIEFKGQETRTFRADFVDREGNHGTGTVTLTLTCVTGTACAGSCVDLMTSNSHCGSCAIVCNVSGSLGGCSGGRCQTSWGACFSQTDGFATCSAYCTSIALSCAAAGCDGWTTEEFGDMGVCQAQNAPTRSESGACDSALTWLAAGTARHCCCGGT